MFLSQSTQEDLRANNSQNESTPGQVASIIRRRVLTLSDVASVVDIVAVGVAVAWASLSTIRTREHRNSDESANESEIEQHLSLIHI